MALEFLWLMVYIFILLTLKQMFKYDDLIVNRIPNEFFGTSLSLPILLISKQDVLSLSIDQRSRQRWIVIKIFPFRYLLYQKWKLRTFQETKCTSQMNLMSIGLSIHLVHEGSNLSYWWTNRRSHGKQMFANTVVFINFARWEIEASNSFFYKQSPGRCIGQNKFVLTYFFDLVRGSLVYQLIEHLTKNEFPLACLDS